MIKKSLTMVTMVLVLAACGDTEPVDPCEANPTTTNILGQCVEADGEACDSDPCDAESDWEWKTPGPATTKDGFGKKPTKAPTTKSTKRK